MIAQSDIIPYTKYGFDSQKYFELQRSKILERISKFSGRLYLEIGGKFMYDSHAARVLPGFDPEIKKKIFQDLSSQADMIFCSNYDDILSDRQLSNENISYQDYVLKMLKQLEENINIKPVIAINKMPHGQNLPEVFVQFKQFFEGKGYKVYQRYLIENYATDMNKAVSDDGFGRDDYINISHNLIFVTGAASNSGKMSTCLGQIYLDREQGLESGYAKYETFPIWNFPLNHPVNLAYEAATVDIKDYNMIDTYHLAAYGKESVNYNRDVEAFDIVIQTAKMCVSPQNFINTYKSPTDMGINYVGFCVTNDEIVCVAACREVLRRKERYQEIIARGQGEAEWLTKCDEIYAKAMEYMRAKEYDAEMEV